jgi:hypothetical protein
MKITDIAFVIPIHPPKYIYIYTLINKLIKEDIYIDIYLVFSNTDDYNAFNMKSNINPIIITGIINNKSIITFKKFYGLNQLILSKYHYLICCDSEIDIITEHFTNINMLKKINDIFSNRIIYAGDITGIWANKILEASARLFENEINRLKSITNDFNLYFWWSDLPVYRVSDLDVFFNTININMLISDQQFDYIIYQYFLILTDDFKIINTSPITNIKWSLESLNTNNVNILNSLYDLKYGFSWLTFYQYNLNKEYFLNKKSFILYHLDRLEGIT